MKKCSICKVLKGLSEFSKGQHAPDGLQYRCKTCMADYKRKERDENPEKVRSYNRAVYDATSKETLMLTTARSRAKKKGWGFSLTEQDIKIPENCPIFGIPLVRGKNHFCPNSPSLDRIDSSKGYTPDNVWVISMKANAAKGNLTLSELKLLVEKLEEKMIESKLHETRKG